MVGVGSYICGRYIFHDSFEKVGWKWGKPQQYFLAIGLAIFLWFVPRLLESLFGIKEISSNLSYSVLLMSIIFNFVVALIPVFGEEVGWRGYMLPHLLQQYSTRQALLLHGLVTWFWHLPIMYFMAINLNMNLLLSVTSVLLISLIPTVMHAIVLAHFWSVSHSIAVSTVYHTAFDELKDSLDDNLGTDPFAEIWQMVTVTLLGGYLLWKAKWHEHASLNISEYRYLDYDQGLQLL